MLCLSIILLTLFYNPSLNVVGDSCALGNWIVGYIDGEDTDTYIRYELLDIKGNPDRSLLVGEPIRDLEFERLRALEDEAILEALHKNSDDSKQGPDYLVSSNKKNKESGDDINSTHKNDVELLYLLVHHEAGNQDLDGCRLVCDVVLNRVDSKRFPNTIKEVIFQKGQFTTATILYSIDVTNISDKVKKAVNMELSGRRLDTESLFFARKPVTSIGLYQYGAHYFSK